MSSKYNYYIWTEPRFWTEPNLSFFQKTEQNRTEKKSIPHIPAKLATSQLFTAR